MGSSREPAYMSELFPLHGEQPCPTCHAALSVPAPQWPTSQPEDATETLADALGDLYMLDGCGSFSDDEAIERAQRVVNAAVREGRVRSVPAPEEPSPEDYAAALHEIAVLEKNVRDARQQIADLQRSHEITDRENDALRAARWWVCPECGYHASISRKRGWRPRCRARHNGVRCTRTANSTGYCSSHARLFKPQPSIRGEA